MKKDSSKLKGLSNSLREKRGQIIKSNSYEECFKGRYDSNSLYAKYLKKRQLGNFDLFDPTDLCFYYLELSKVKGIRFSIRWHIDKKAFIELLKDYSSKELVFMLDYVFSKNCKLKIDLRRFSPAALQVWKNSVYAESQDCLNSTAQSPREWCGDSNENTRVMIGEWGSDE